MKYITKKQLAIHMSRELRQNLTPAEKIFWQKVRNKKFLGYKFQRQYPIFFIFNNKERFFIADFYCHALQLVIEIDGGIHEKQKEYDNLRSEIIYSQKELFVMRFKNEEVLNNINSVLIKLRNLVTQPRPFPLEGRVSEGRDG